MKKLMILLLLVNAYSSKAQTAGEWTRQKATQIKYLYQQLAALKVYGERLKEGYDIARKGLVTVRDIRSGEWHQHEAFFEAMDRVSPAIKSYSRIGDILLLQGQIVKQITALRRQLPLWPLLSAAERAHIQRVCTSLLEEGVNDLEELLAVTTDSAYQMSDAARLQRIEALFIAMQEKGAFLQAFRRSVTSLASKKKAELRDTQLSKRLNGLL